MEITEVRVKLVERSSERLRAFCSITLDGDFVIRDLKIIDGTNGAFVAMPSRKLADRCNRCGCKNHLRAKYCNECGQKLNENRAPKDGQGRAKLHADVAHPINAGCRERIQNAVVVAFQEELERAKSPDYKPAKYDDFDEDADEIAATEEARPAPAPAPAPPPKPAPKVTAQPAGEEDEEEMGDYNSLIADLKREAATRREKHDEERAGARGFGGPPPRREPPQWDKSPAPEQSSAPPPPPPRAPSPPPPRASSPPPPRAPSPPPPAPAKPRVEQEEDDFAAGL